MNEEQEAVFWGECGEVSSEKLNTLIRKYRNTHLCFAKWDIKSGPFERMVSHVIGRLKKARNAPVDFINFPEVTRNYISKNGEILIQWDQVELKQWA